MIKHLTVEGFRGFEQFLARDLGRVNLMVGENNCGKTSILEAVQLFGSSGDPSALWQIALRRGERLFDNIDSRRVRPVEAEICHLFHGHRIDIGSSFKIVAHTDTADESLTARVSKHSRQENLFDNDSQSDSGLDDLIQEPDWALDLNWSGHPLDAARFPISVRGGISFDSVRRHVRSQTNGSAHVNFISTAGLMVHDIINMFENVVLTKEEDLVIEALTTIEPEIERIATIGGEGRRNFPGERGGIVVKHRDSSQRIPIGSMGDGMWRMLGLALALVSAENGILLVDEIDTGLHFTVLERMWKLVEATSRRLNVQVFATTHSRDAFESLAVISRDSVSERSEVTIQKIDRLKSKSVVFTEQEIIASADRGIEVR